MKIAVTHTMSSEDVALALALEAELHEGSTRQVAAWVEQQSKTAIREIVKRRVENSGGRSEFWPETSEPELVRAAREREMKIRTPSYIDSRYHLVDAERLRMIREARDTGEVVTA